MKQGLAIIKLSFLLNLLILCNISYSQVDELKKALDTWRNDYPQEKVYLQTDKSYYTANEEIWIKAWCTTTEGPTYLSRILYLDLVDKKGKVIQKKMYQLDSLGSTAADFSIPADIISGNYSLNAYTLWMLNFPDFVFKKNIFIYGKDYNTTVGKSTQSAKLKLQFFPEGGQLIEGVENRIAFKATDQNGYPVNFGKGQIEDENGSKIIDINTEHDGMGAFELLPRPGEKYKVSVTYGGNSSLDFNLPEAKAEGITLKVNNSNANRLFVLIKRGEKNKESFNEIKVVTQLNYQVINSTVLNIDEGQSAISINKKGLPPGILQITVFDKNNLPIAERIAFNENYSIAQPSINPELKNLVKKGKNRISFTIDSLSAPSLSCLVTGYDPGSEDDDNIASYLLFGTELRGPVFNQGYYVKDKNAVTLKNLDLLLMTQGWRRFNWKKIINNDPLTLKYPVESAITFRGMVYKSDRKEVVKDGKVSFIIRGVDSTSILAEAEVTDKGEFLLPGIHYKKEAEIAYMGTNNKKENFIVDVKLLPNYIDSLNYSQFIPNLDLDTLNLAEGRSQLLASLHAGMNNNDSSGIYKSLENVTIKTKKLSRTDSLNNEYATGVFQSGKSIDPADFKNAFTIWQMLQASVPGITVEGNPFDPSVSFNRFSGLAIPDPVGGEESSDPLSTPNVLEEGGIAYYINEVNVSKDVINSLSVSDVAFIKVLKNEAAALGVTQGAIAFYTKTGKDISARIYDKTYTKERHAGYSISKEFFSPDYTKPEKLLEPDNRYTLYWNGSISPSKDGKYRFEFYNNDTNKKVRLIIQGIDALGQLIFKQIIIE